MKVADVMQTHVECIAPDTRIEDVARFLFEKGINGIPVCKKKKLVGFITQKDILHQLYPTPSEVSKTHPHTYDFEKMEKKVSHTLQLTAQDVMSVHIITISPQTPLLQALSLMFVKKIGRLPVIDQKNHLIGLITKADIFKSLVGNKLALAENEEYNDWLTKHYYGAIDWKKRLHFEIPDIINVLEESRVHTLLDVGCGIGEHAFSLAQKGYEAIGIERSKLMIEEARKRREQLPKEMKARVSFFSGEHEQILPSFKKNIDAVIFMGNAIVHNPYNYEAVLQKTAQKLTPHGVMIFQIRNMRKILQRRVVQILSKPIHVGFSQQRMLVELYSPSSEQNRRLVTSTSSIFDFDGSKWAFFDSRSAPLAYIDKQTLEPILKTLGFHRLEYYGATAQWDYLFKNPFDPDKSDWLNVIAKR